MEQNQKEQFDNNRSYYKFDFEFCITIMATKRSLPNFKFEQSN